jgi:hypothetical protein
MVFRLNSLKTMSGTKSILFESIQQSPIDALMLDDTECALGGVITPELAALLEENPQTPPLETRPEPRLRFLNPRAWVDQLGSSSLRGDTGVMVKRNSDMGITATSLVDGFSIDISHDGLELTHAGNVHKLSEKIERINSIPIDVLGLLSQAYEIISSWRSRVVRLSMETDDYECSLMDDLHPPRTFLVEFKQQISLKSVRFQGGVAYFQTSNGEVRVSIDELEKQKHKTKWIHNQTTLLDDIDIDDLWPDLVQLRGLCLDEDARLTVDAQVHAPVSGG